MRLNQIISVKSPTFYELIMTLGLLIIIASSYLTYTSQAEMKKNYVTKDYIYSFYITKDQFQIIENERPKYMARVRSGENIETVTTDYNKFVDRIISLRIRGLEDAR